MSLCTCERIDAKSVRCTVCGVTFAAPEEAGPVFRQCGPAPSRGLGDTIAKVTGFLGIPTCGGCGVRQEWLNEHVPYGQR